ncbi:MAG: hypothetical protein CYPHOPRED_004945 [Cyphobasidiales sp. Tagirdzhanova-0007]|nr:MAG: hypothetical protein CYPHOPRED_004945 [Cyphobasidiales sp. Tagirdzhanova-0007]
MASSSSPNGDTDGHTNRDTDGLDSDQIQQFYRDGYLVIPDFFDKATCSSLLERSRQLIADFDLEKHPKTKFATGRDDHVGDDYFLESNDKIRFFFEEDAFDSTGNLTRPKEQSINKVGHALHELDDRFRAFSLQNERLQALARSLDYHKDPRVLQSMIICKQPRIGGKVPVHDDSTFLYTDPPTALGFWFALEDCRVTNGSLSFLPGSHKLNRPIAKRFVRQAGGGTGFENLAREEEIDHKTRDWDGPLYRERWKVEECDAGTLVLIDGAVIHRSERNTISRTVPYD